MMGLQRKASTNSSKPCLSKFGTFIGHLPCIRQLRQSPDLWSCRFRTRWTPRRNATRKGPEKLVWSNAFLAPSDGFAQCCLGRDNQFDCSSSAPQFQNMDRCILIVLLRESELPSSSSARSTRSRSSRNGRRPCMTSGMGTSCTCDLGQGSFTLLESRAMIVVHLRPKC